MKLTLFSCVLLAILCGVATVDVASICGSQTNETLASRIKVARYNVSQWLVNNREKYFGWSLGNTANAVTSLKLVNHSWIAEPSLETQLTLKILNLDILSELSRSSERKYHRKIISRLPDYIMALNATCQNTMDFHGVDLISLQNDQMRRFQKDGLNNYYQHALGVLSMCSTGNPVKWLYIDELLQGQRPDGCFHKPCSSTCRNEGIDVTSMVLSALACVLDTTFSHNMVTLTTGIDKAVVCLVGAHINGSFGNTVNNAMAAQALLAAGVNYSRWDCHATMTSIIDDIHTDGHFGNLAATIQILPLLAGRHLSHIHELEFECPRDYYETIEPTLPPLIETENIRIILLQVLNAQNLTDIHYEAEGNIGDSLLVLMYREQAANRGFYFDSEMTRWGAFITSINGVSNDEFTHSYWIIEKEDINRQRQCVDKGAADIIPENRDHYVWIYLGCGSV